MSDIPELIRSPNWISQRLDKVIFFDIESDPPNPIAVNFNIPASGYYMISGSVDMDGIHYVERANS